MDSSPPPTSPAPIEKQEVKQEMKQDMAKKPDKSITDSFATDITGISAVEDILQLLKVLYCLSTNSAYDFGEGGMC